MRSVYGVSDCGGIWVGLCVMTGSLLTKINAGSTDCVTCATVGSVTSSSRPSSEGDVCRPVSSGPALSVIVVMGRRLVHMSAGTNIRLVLKGGGWQ